MARHTFGGGVSDWTFASVDGVDGVNDLAQLTGGVIISFYNAETGGTQHTDLINEGGSPATTITSSNGGDGRSVGTIPPFQGPDGVTQMWATAGGGPRTLMVASDAGADAATAVSAAATANAGVATHAGSGALHKTTYAQLDDVDMTGLLNGQVPVWNGTSARWRPGTPSAAPGSTAAAAILVASSDMPTIIKNAADYVCDGTADQVEINAAITAAVAAAGSRGHVLLTGGRFNISGSILMRTGVWLSGAGRFTELKATGLSAVTGSGDQVAVVKLFDVNTHLTEISNLWIQGNSSSGGTGHGICYESSSSGDSHSAYPDSNPDPDHGIRDLFISNFSNSPLRHGIYLRTDLRGSMVGNLQMRGFGGCGIFLESAPDCHFFNIHLGTCGDTGFKVATGNAKFSNCKAFYCDQWGFDVSSGRGQLTGCESQDNANGVRLTGASYSVTGMIIDTSETTGLHIGANSLNVTGLTVLNRGNGRYPTTATGILFSGSPSNCHVQGIVTASNVTTKVAGTYTAGTNFVRISDGSTLIVQGA